MPVIHVLLAICLPSLWFSIATCWTPVIETSLGSIMGNRKAYKGVKYDEFLGLPYGAPPVGKLRWKKTQPVEPWAPLIYDATKFSAHCTQFMSILYPFIGMGGKSSEDCLYLNIWVPVRKEKSKLPVILWVYGGGFLIGTGEMYPGYLLALHTDTIVVSFNYRVSSLGWLSTGDENMPGNYGLWDTRAVLHWVRDHIKSFGGDPHLITAVGQSAGAAIVSHLMISKDTNKLIKNAVCLSGASTGFFGLSVQPLRLSLLMAKIFGCPTGSTKVIEMCLRDVDAELLDFWGVTGQRTYEKRNPTLLPVIDGDFIHKHPRESFIEGAGKHVNLISGYLYDDAFTFTFAIPLGIPLKIKNHSAVSNESLWNHMRQWYGFLNNTDEIITMIINKYPNMDTSDKQIRGRAITQAMTDAWFAASSNWESTAHASFKFGRTYQFLFRHRQTFISSYEDWVNGSHTDDLYSVFGPPFLEVYRKLILRKDFSEDDHKVNNHLMSYIGNFAHTGDPNKGRHNVVHWPTFDKDSQLIVELSASPRTETFHTNNTLKRFHFNVDLLKHYVYPPQPSIPPVNEPLNIKEAIENMRSWMYSMLDDQLYKQSVDDVISKFQRKRLQILSKNAEVKRENLK